MARNKKRRPGPMKGVEASAAPGRPVHGPAGPAQVLGPRGELCRLLSLREPSDQELYRAAVARIKRLKAETE